MEALRSRKRLTNRRIRPFRPVLGAKVNLGGRPRRPDSDAELCLEDFEFLFVIRNGN